MIANGCESSPKVAKCFMCNICDYNTCKNSDYVKHLSTNKHKRKENASKMVDHDSNLSTKVTKQYKCNCGKSYKYNSGYYRHVKTCDKKHTQPIVTAELIIELLKDNKNLQQLISEQNTTIHSLIQNGPTNSSTHSSNNVNVNVNSTNNNNTTNNSFNLNVFLNETCKDAMNITDFVSSVNVSLEDLEHTGKYGYIEGITNIIINKLNKLERHLRPLHCSDHKREVMYIKDNNEWTKDSDSKPILTKAIKTIANENMKQINKWRENYPDCVHADSKKNKMYLNIVSNSMNGLTKEEGEKNINKIISNIAKEVIINKK